MAIVRLTQVGKSYNGLIAMDDISLEIPSGHFLTLLGPSGCGKTTTLRSIAGLVQVDQGQITIDGQDVTHLPPHERDLSIVFQSHALFPHLTVIDNVAFGLRMKGVHKISRRASAQEMLNLVGLDSMSGRYPHQLSGGQQQRVALARALVVKPRVLLLDEPFGALDRKLRENMQQELRSLTRRLGITSIFVTHDQEEALLLSDKVAVMNRGRVEQIGTPCEIFENPSTSFVADFMGVSNIFDVTLTRNANGENGFWLGALFVNWKHHSQQVDNSQIVVGIRPERIDISLDFSYGCATLLDIIYLGGKTKYIIQLHGSSQRLCIEKVTPRSDTVQRNWKIDDKVGINFHSDSIFQLSS